MRFYAFESEFSCPCGIDRPTYVSSVTLFMPLLVSTTRQTYMQFFGTHVRFFCVLSRGANRTGGVFLLAAPFIYIPVTVPASASGHKSTSLISARND